MTVTTDSFVQHFIADVRGHELDVERLVTTPSGLPLEGMVEAMHHPEVGTFGIALLADFMAPEGSVYYDAIFGAYHGQAAIRGWLVPAMADISWIEFVPMAEPVVFDDGLGGTWLDEWQMSMELEGQRIPLARGVSVRRWRDGWLTWACDVYDTAAFRVPPPPELVDPNQPPLPAVPRVVWPVDDTVTGGVLGDPRHPSGAFHPTDSVFIDPVAGEIRGAAAIAAFLAEAAAAAGSVVYEPLGPMLGDGSTAVQEWRRRAPDADPSTALRGTSVRRMVDGLIVAAIDYYDVASLPDATAP
jgi:hypothetical protein